ncbi:alcohol dehydrogenase catalytic domain-containing protein [Spirillospora sp. NPDC029432]|uniref:zinc-dependent alcohol dehydrogenase n=1 Tax=Spirillospora sp. NPDC029432 TaxID=3154599 RepID=UPI003451E114
MSQIVLGADGAVHLEPAPPPPAPGPDEVLLAPVRIGICGSDVHVLRKVHPFIAPPVVTGHECAARVLAAGAAVTSCAPGDLVVVNPLYSCGTCPACRRGATNLCSHAKVMGFALPGLARDRVVVEGRFCHRVPPGIPPRLAALTEPLAVGRHAVGRAPVNLGRVLIVGGGPVGLAVLLAARHAEHVTLVEPVRSKRDLAAALGATRVITPDETPPEVDTAFDCVAAAPTLATAAAATVPGGTIVVVGVPRSATELALPRLQRWEIDVRGTGLYTGADIDAVLADPPAGAERLVTADLPADRAADAFAATADPDQIKVLIGWPDPAA